MVYFYQTKVHRFLLLFSILMQASAQAGGKERNDFLARHEEIRKECRAVLREFVQSEELIDSIRSKRNELENLTGKCVIQNGFNNGYNFDTQTCFDCTKNPYCENDPTCISQCSEKLRIIFLENELRDSKAEVVQMEILVKICLAAVAIFFIGQMVINVLFWRKKQDRFDKTEQVDADRIAEEVSMRNQTQHPEEETLV